MDCLQLRLYLVLCEGIAAGIMPEHSMRDFMSNNCPYDWQVVDIEETRLETDNEVSARLTDRRSHLPKPRMMSGQVPRPFGRHRM
jgi:hypothetical protein